MVRARTTFRNQLVQPNHFTDSKTETSAPSGRRYSPLASGWTNVPLLVSVSFLFLQSSWCTEFRHQAFILMLQWSLCENWIRRWMLCRLGCCLKSPCPAREPGIEPLVASEGGRCGTRPGVGWSSCSCGRLEWTSRFKCFPSPSPLLLSLCISLNSRKTREKVEFNDNAKFTWTFWSFLMFSFCRKTFFLIEITWNTFLWGAVQYANRYTA